MGSTCGVVADKRMWLMTTALFFLTVSLANAASGTSLPDLTGGVVAFLSALRDVEFVDGVAVVLFGLVILGAGFGFMGAGFIPILLVLIGLGGWMGSETVTKTIYTSSAIFF